MARENQPAARDKGSYSIQSVDNALMLLEALGDDDEVVRISHLSEKLGMNKTTVFRLMATFEKRGYVEKESNSGHYRLGVSAYEMGQKFLSRMTLLRKARPIMEELGRNCDEALYLAIRRNHEVLFLDLVETSQRVKVISLLGNRYPLARTSAGRIILAHAADSRKSPSVKPPTARAPLIPEEDLEQIRQQGFCVETGEAGEGIVTLAVPLFRAGAELAGCLCMVGPEYRMDSERLTQELLPRLREAGEAISSKLGHLSRYL